MNVNHTIDLKPKSKLPTVMEEFTQTRKLCAQLLDTKHYKQIGEEGILAILTTANALGVNPIKALNGELYYFSGKVEMSAILMAQVIRAKGHSFTQDKGSNDTICILHGKRKDNGDTWKTSFSVDDAKRAGIHKTGPWTKYPDDMCYNRALSKLARKLFPDVIGSCYVEGEISDAPPLYDSIPKNTVETTKIEELSHQENTAPAFFADEEETSVVDSLNYLKELLEEGFSEERLANFQSYVTKKYKVETLDELDNSDCLWLINKIEESERKAQ